MKIGISVPNNWGVMDATRLVDLAVRAEAAGFDAVWTSEHLINLAYVRARIGDGPYYHPLSILSAIAARTSRIVLGTSVIVMPFHNPFDLAKYVATLDQLSRGRVILGVGVGNMKDEFDAAGVTWTTRGSVTDEAIDVLRALWAPGVAAHEGKHWRFADVHTAPKPWQERAIPIWIGGMSEAALKRTARAGDGWQPTALTTDELRGQISQLHALTRAEGRDPARLAIGMRFNIALDDVTVTEVELRSTIKGYDRDRIIAVAQDFANAGATHFIYALNSSDPDVLDATVDALARDLLPHFRKT